MEKLIGLFFAVTLTTAITAADIIYDHRSLIVNGVRKLFFSGSIHYPRSTPQMWPSLIAQAKEGGIDVIDTYVFWNLHEQQEGQYDFSGRSDLVRFIKEIKAQGLYACLRIGPFIEGEWNYGGLPFWLHDIPGIIFRTDNEPFKYYMKNFTTKIVNMMKTEKLYASQGGPIILSQIENEYGMIQAAFGEKGESYVRWAAAMAVSLDTGVPWVMCKQIDAPDPVINTCNGLKCGETFSGPNSAHKPSLWTENWTTVFQTFGEEQRLRSAEDIAFHVALFIAKNGSFVNYYMYHGGTNFARTASAYVMTSYYDAAPIDEYGLIREPIWSHLKELHAAIKESSDTLLYGEGSTLYLGEMQYAHVFRRQGVCAAFLVNNDTTKVVKVFFQNSTYDLPRKSISILTDCRSVAFNTAKVRSQQSRRSIQLGINMNALEQWQEYREDIPGFDDTPFRTNTLLEHMNTTKDTSDYLWYTFRVNGVPPESTQVDLQVQSLGHILHAYVNGKFIASGHGIRKNSSFTLESEILLRSGINNVSLLSATVGLPDSGAYLERKAAGIRSVQLQGSNGSLLFTPNEWGYQVGLRGEMLQIYSEKSSKVKWSKLKNSSQSLTWYKTLFDAPEGTDPVALNLGSMRKGEVWVNNESIGRYWVSFHDSKGAFQQWYHVPLSFLKPSGNVLVLFEEEGASPLGISLDIISSTKAHGSVQDCHVSEKCL